MRARKFLRSNKDYKGPPLGAEALCWPHWELIFPRIRYGIEGEVGFGFRV